MHVWISERVSGLSELKANNSPESPPPPPPSPPASVEETKADSSLCQRLLGFINSPLRQRHQRLHPSLIINWFLRLAASLLQTICKNRLHNNRDHRNNHKMMKRSLRLENNESTTAWGAANLQLFSENTSLSLSNHCRVWLLLQQDLQTLICWSEGQRWNLFGCWGSFWFLWRGSTCFWSWI